MFAENFCFLISPQAEELIKKEMITMLRHDIVNHPTSNQVELLKQKKTRNATQAVIAANQTALERNEYEKFTEEEMNETKRLLQKEMEFVKQRIGHGDLPIESYSKVWEECYAQVGAACRGTGCIKYCLYYDVSVVRCLYVIVSFLFQSLSSSLFTFLFTSSSSFVSLFLFSS